MTPTDKKPLTPLEIILERPWRRSQSELLLTYLQASSLRHSLFTTTAFAFLNKNLADEGRVDTAKSLLDAQRHLLPVGCFIRQLEVVVKDETLTIVAYAVDIERGELKRSTVDHQTNHYELLRLAVDKDTEEPYVVDEELLGTVLSDVLRVIDNKISRGVELPQVAWLYHLNPRDIRGKKHQHGRPERINSQAIITLIKEQAAKGHLRLYLTKHAIIVHTDQGVYNISRPHVFL